MKNISFAVACLLYSTTQAIHIKDVARSSEDAEKEAAK